MRSSNPRPSGHQRPVVSGGRFNVYNTIDTFVPLDPVSPLNPLDRLDFAIGALKGLGNLIGAARTLEHVNGDEIALLARLLTDELECCARQLRKH